MIVLVVGINKENHSFPKIRAQKQPHNNNHIKNQPWIYCIGAMLTMQKIYSNINNQLQIKLHDMLN